MYHTQKTARKAASFYFTDPITNSFKYNLINSSKIMSSFFRKESVQDFFFLRSNRLDFTKVIKTKPSYFKKTPILLNNQSKKPNTIETLNYIYKPDAILNTSSNLECFFLRKNKSFNKGRYSRNRQVYRTGVYMCFYINVIALYLL